MPSRPLLFVGLIAAAFIVPYVATDKDFVKTAGDQWGKLTGGFKSKPKEPSLEELIDQLTAEHPPLTPWVPEPYSNGQDPYGSRGGVRARTVSSPSEGNGTGSSGYNSGSTNSGSSTTDSSGSGGNSYGSTGNSGTSGNSYGSYGSAGNTSNSGSTGSGTSGSSFGSSGTNNNSSSSGSSTTNSYNSGSASTAARPADTSGSPKLAGGVPGAAPPLPDSLLEGPAIFDLWEVFRFDAPPAWVMARWKRVSTVTSERNLRGLRVPLMTGTRMDDLAGSLTYYYDKNQQVQRITFEGVTGDDARLVQLVTEQYGLRPVPSLQAGLYLGQTRSRITAVLRVSNPPVVLTKEPLKRMEVALEINRPDSGIKMSDHMTDLLKADRLQKKW